MGAKGEGREPENLPPGDWREIFCADGDGGSIYELTISLMLVITIDHCYNGEMRKKKYSVIIPNEVYPKPSQREISAAYILSDYFDSDVEFVPRSTYKSPDFLIKGEYWELKTPTGKGKYNIQHALKSASRQAENIIIDARFSKLHIARIKNELRYELKEARKIQKIILIDKKKKILAFYDE